MFRHDGLDRSSTVSAISVALCQQGGKHQSRDTVQGLQEQKVKPASRFPLSKQQSTKRHFPGLILNPALMFTSHFNSFLLICRELFSEDTRVSAEHNIAKLFFLARLTE